MDRIIIPVTGVPYSGHPEHFIYFCSVFDRKIAERYYIVIAKAFPDPFRPHEFQKCSPVFIGHMSVGIFCEFFLEIKVIPGNNIVIIILDVILPVADSITAVKIHIVYNPVVGSEGGDHTVLLGTHLLLL